MSTELPVPAGFTPSGLWPWCHDMPADIVSIEKTQVNLPSFTLGPVHPQTIYRAYFCCPICTAAYWKVLDV